MATLYHFIAFQATSIKWNFTYNVFYSALHRIIDLPQFYLSIRKLILLNIKRTVFYSCRFILEAINDQFITRYIRMNLGILILMLLQGQFFQMLSNV